MKSQGHPRPESTGQINEERKISTIDFPKQKSMFISWSVHKKQKSKKTKESALAPLRIISESRDNLLHLFFLSNSFLS